MFDDHEISFIIFFEDPVKNLSIKFLPRFKNKYLNVMIFFLFLWVIGIYDYSITYMFIRSYLIED